jgi:hypothetical protein
MTTLLRLLLYTLVRYALATIAGIFIARGVWTHEEAAQFVTPEVVSWIAAALGVAAMGLYATYRSRLKFLAALRSPLGTTEQDIKDDLKHRPPSILILPFLVAVSLPIVSTTYAACASSIGNGVVANAYHQTELGLGAVQDAEMFLYKAGTAPTLTLERHQAISRVFVAAFESQIAMGHALLAWRRESGLPPAGYNEWIRANDDALMAVADLLPADATLMASTIKWSRNVAVMVRALGLEVPPRFAAISEQLVFP